MNKHWITEQDIFNYVFYPGSLTSDKKNYLDSNQNDYIEQIEFCRSLNQTLEPINDSADFERQKCKVIDLYPVKLNVLNSSNHLTLAAASSQLNKRIETKTFTDDNSQFLVRLVAADGEKKLYVFSKNKEFKEARLTLFPSQKCINIKSFELPISIDNLEDVEKISIEEYN